MQKREDYSELQVSMRSALHSLGGALGKMGDTEMDYLEEEEED